MKTLISVLLLFSFCFGNAQADPDLQKRLDDYMRFSRALDFVKTMDYVHPNVFTIAPKEDMIRMMEMMFSNDIIEISIDSASVSGISPIFIHNNSSYHHVGYRMQITMRVVDNEMAANKDFIQQVIAGAKANFGADEIYYDESKKTFVAKGVQAMIAVKDPGADWLFIGVVKNSEYMDKIVVKEVLRHFNIQE